MWRLFVAGVRGIGLCLLFAYLSLAVFPVSSARAVDDAAIKALSKAVSDFITALKARPPAAAPVTDADQQQMAGAATAISKFIEPDLAARIWAADLTTLLLDLKASKSGLSDEALKSALFDLRETLPGDGSPAPANPAPPFGKQAHDIETKLEDIRQELSVLPKTLDQTEVGKLQSALTELATLISRSLDPTFAATTWTADLQSILTERKPDQTDKNVLAALNRLRATIPPNIADEGPFLNIVQAWFGDVYYIRRAISGQLRISPDSGTGTRVCDATNEVRFSCQGKQECPIKDNATSQASKPDKAKLCGAHPAPQASGGILGLAIEYQCLEAPRAVWNQLENNWRLEHGDKYKPKTVLLRAATDASIRCKASLKDD